MATDQQFVVLDIVRGRETPGRKLRAELEARGIKKDRAVFYQLMARMEGAGLIEGSYFRNIIDGRGFREKQYKVTGAGEAAYQAKLAFYKSQLRETGGLLSGEV